MTTPERVPDPFLCAEDDALAEAIRISNAQADLAALPPLDRQDYYDRLDGHVCPDNCGICGSEGCDACRDCRCRRCDPYVPEYVRTSVKRWRPAS
jgi:hypothetical protein